jgi:hypothetical protein
MGDHQERGAIVGLKERDSIKAYTGVPYKVYNWLGCGRANITEAGTRGRRAVIAPRARKLRRTCTPRASPARARALRIPGAMGRCRRGTPIWSKDGRLCACGLYPRASPARARALRIPGLEGTGGVARKLEAEASRGEHYRQLIPVDDDAFYCSYRNKTWKWTPWLTSARAQGMRTCG